MEKEYGTCRICPRNCGIARNAGTVGICGETADLRVSWAGLHFGEEPPVTGIGGSGTIFITGCNLKCKFCQNFQISQDGMGRITPTEEFADICLELAKVGAENINIVTGSHAIPAIATGLTLARKNGLTIPVLWNSSAYETPEHLSRLNGLVNVWLPDLKTLNPILSENLFHAADYPKVAKKAIKYMTDCAPLTIAHPDDEKLPAGKIISGVIVRHLALPGRIADTELALRWFADTIADKAMFSLMTQYTPVKENPHAADIDAFPDRLIGHDEYRRLTRLLEEFEIDTGFYQELIADTSWLPDFNRYQPFSSELARPIWHWQYGFKLPQAE